MSAEVPTAEGGPQNPGKDPSEQATEDRTEVTFRYAGPSQAIAEDGKTTVALAGNVQRAQVRAEGRVKDAVRLREALSALHDVVSSDFRYVPKDRTAYMAYMRLRKQAAGMNLWEAQRAYVDWLQRNDPLAFLILDPILSVHPDELLLEVFSKDEGSYAKLGVDWSALETSGDIACGTTNIDYTQGLFDGVQRMRSYRETRLQVSSEAVQLDTSGAPTVLEKKVRVPDSWLRGFLQVQSAGTLPRTVFSIAPVDLYNVLRHLRFNADPKKGGRGVRVELVPGEPPRLVLEPWELVLPTSAGIYAGRAPQVVRIWGRRRLMLLKRLLPFATGIDVHLLGTGLPSFYVVRAGPITFTLGLSGFTSSNWAQAVSFDLLLPRAAGAKPSKPLDQVIAYLEKRWFAPVSAITADLGLTGPDALEALQRGCQQGKLMFDVARDVYRFRPLTDAPLDQARLAFRNDRERRASDLVAGKASVKIVSENRIHGVGLELTGKVVVEAEKREYRPMLLLDDDGRVRKAECTCVFFRKHQLKEGPCEHLVALRLHQSREEMRRREQRGGARSAVTLETRTYAKRHARGEDVYQIALDRQRVKLRWGPRGADARVQTLVFNTAERARAAYFERVDDLETRGFLDATSST